MKIPVSSKFPAAKWPRQGVPEYVFRVRSSGGPTLGVDVKEFDWTLEVDSKRAMVSVESFRSDADIPGQPAGIFRFAVDDALLRDFLKLATDANLGRATPVMQGHPGYTERLYELLQPPARKVELRINNSDEATNASIAPLRNKINSLLAQSFNSPERAVKTEVKADGDRFAVTVTNIGTERVRFTDPRWVLVTGPNQRAAILITDFPETKPTDPPPFLDWKEVRLSPMTPRPTSEPVVTLEPGASWTGTSTSFKRAKGMRYLAYFTWANYAGDPMIDGVYRLRGRVDSPRAVISP